jgi:hypothetical protein
MSKEVNRNAVRDELEEIAPQLARLKGVVPPVDIPDGYFDQLTEDVMQRIRTEEAAGRRTAAETPRQPWWSDLVAMLYRPAYAMALAGVVILLVSVLVMRQTVQPEGPPELAMSDEDIHDYISYHIDEFDLGLLAEEITDRIEEVPLLLEEDSLEDQELEDLFDELLDEVELDELL